MNCKRKQICSVCEAPFKMERGCLLEKRCKACRFLNLQTKQKETWLNGIYIPVEAMIEYNNNRNELSKHKRISNIKNLTYQELEESYETEYNEWEGLIERTKEHLRENEYLVIKKRFIYGLTLEDIAENMYLSRERIRQIESSAIKKLKHPRTKKELIKPYMK